MEVVFTLNVALITPVELENLPFQSCAKDELKIFESFENEL